MKSRIFTIAFAILLSVSCFGRQKGAGILPAMYIEKIDSIPDLMQTDPELGLPEGGMRSCDSVSATNSFAWMADHGYENMMIRDDDGKVSYARTAQRMDRIFSQAANRLPSSFLEGVERYLSERGYTAEEYRLEFQSWSYPEGFKGEKIPRLNTIKKGILGDGGVWLFVGFYQFDEQKDAYQIISHHYVTLVGYGMDENGKENPYILIVHDPAPRSGPGISHNYVQIEEIAHGRITIDPDSQAASAYSQLPIDAAGYYKLGGGLAYNEKAAVAILDGVIILEMK